MVAGGNLWETEIIDSKCHPLVCLQKCFSADRLWRPWLSCGVLPGWGCRDVL